MDSSLYYMLAVTLLGSCMNIKDMEAQAWSSGRGRKREWYLRYKSGMHHHHTLDMISFCHWLSTTWEHASLKKNILDRQSVEICKQCTVRGEKRFKLLTIIYFREGMISEIIRSPDEDYFILYYSYMNRRDAFSMTFCRCTWQVSFVTLASFPRYVVVFYLNARASESKETDHAMAVHFSTRPESSTILLPA